MSDLNKTTYLPEEMAEEIRGLKEATQDFLSQPGTVSMETVAYIKSWIKEHAGKLPELKMSVTGDNLLIEFDAGELSGTEVSFDGDEAQISVQ